jgi:hypothetical protein
MEENAKHAPFTQDHPKPAEKLAAYLMGRWKNGSLQIQNADGLPNNLLIKSLSRNPCG